MATSQDSPSKRPEVEEFGEALEAVIASKGRHYSNLATLSLRFSGDNNNTEASKEGLGKGAFTDFASSIATATKENLNDKVCIEADDKVPARPFARGLVTLSENIGQCIGWTLLLFH